jgi:hypothetical protein
LAAEDDLINDIAHDERLRKAKERGEEDESSTQQAFPPVPADKGAQVLEVSLETRIALLAGHTVFRQFPGKAPSKKGKPGAHVSALTSQKKTETFSSILKNYIS